MVSFMRTPSSSITDHYGGRGGRVKHDLQSTTSVPAFSATNRSTPCVMEPISTVDGSGSILPSLHVRLLTRP